ncbi:hypothetical protein F5B22DRAFT_620749 [Xylaria bambusicola]|uniref:uncharacterized protein n=1 Tax=Xylaria bambusicola TaxID=326684 RepID=UPI0020076060|nr:uncharacterized protein F5B22DRAFT_620749 [Xylaria bambusicola]KAI0508498.1 hypothetical protein F5B22DRAFT_620749 [Xylaria bambusicola]
MHVRRYGRLLLFFTGTFARSRNPRQTERKKERKFTRTLRQARGQGREGREGTMSPSRQCRRKFGDRPFWRNWAGMGWDEMGWSKGYTCVTNLRGFLLPS